MASICDESVKIPRETAENIFQLLTKMQIEIDKKQLLTSEWFPHAAQSAQSTDDGRERLLSAIRQLNAALDPYR
jgi:hypothetical protein